ncbi:MAG: alkene reductase [Nitrincola sp.]|nr:alkene reductase [Nitrincola sp.]
MSNLFQPLQMGALTLKNRIIMAPLTRCRADEGRIPSDMTVEYYRQRASAGMILTEATSISSYGSGAIQTHRAFWSKEQIAGWKKITDAVHAEGGIIALQLWHVGRVSDPIYLNGELPVAPSAIAPAGHVSLVRPEKNYVTPRALETHEIALIIEEYRQAAINAKTAGFDAVEIHAANGYLLEQFLLDGTNKRNDQYGGNRENRARLLLEVTDAIIDIWGADRVGVHLSPRANAHDMSDSNLTETFCHAVRELGKRKIAFICAREAEGEDSIGAMLKSEFGGVFIANEAMTKQSAEKLVERWKS